MERLQQLLDESDLCEMLSETELTVEFDMENFTYGYGHSQYGICKIHQLDDGTPFLISSSGGDWEHEIYIITYVKDDKLAFYIPKNGNCWNWNTYQAFGNNDYEDEEFFKQHNISEEDLSKFVSLEKMKKDFEQFLK